MVRRNLEGYYINDSDVNSQEVWRAWWLKYIPSWGTWKRPRLWGDAWHGGRRYHLALGSQDPLTQVKGTEISTTFLWEYAKMIAIWLNLCVNVISLTVYWFSVSNGAVHSANLDKCYTRRSLNFFTFIIIIKNPHSLFFKNERTIRVNKQLHISFH